MKITKEKIKELDDFFMKEKGAESFVIKRGERFPNILVSAPHAVSQTRDGKYKYSETFSGVLATCLHENLGVSIICKTKNVGDDANWDEEGNEYKKAIKEFCEKNQVYIVFDLHGFAKNRENEINLGTYYGKTMFGDNSLLMLFYQTLNAHGIKKIVLDHPFNAGIKTVSSYVSSQLGIKAMQIEINSKFKKHYPKEIKRFLDIFEKIFTLLQGKQNFEHCTLSYEELQEKDNELMNTESEEAVGYLKGNSKVLICAPHSKTSVFERKQKPSESYSASLGMILNHHFGTNLLYKAKTIDTDFFNTQNNEFKQKLVEVAKDKKAVIDLHIINKQRVDDLAIILPKKYNVNILYELVNIIGKYNIEKFSVNSLFNATKASRIMNMKLGKAFRIQILINFKLFEQKESAEKILAFLRDVVAFFEINEI